MTNCSLCNKPVEDENDILDCGTCSNVFCCACDNSMIDQFGIFVRGKNEGKIRQCIHCAELNALKTKTSLNALTK